MTVENFLVNPVFLLSLYHLPLIRWLAKLRITQKNIIKV
jgi:hypothetical protein